MKFRLFLAALGVSCLCLSGCGGDPAAANAPTGSWIYYATNNGAATTIKKVRSDGSFVSTLATLGPNYQGYAADPTGANVAFGYSKTSLELGALYAIEVAPKVDASTATIKTDFLYDSVGGIQFTWDGKSLIYTAATPADGPSLFRLDLKSGVITRLDDGVDMELSPDGSKILYTKPVGSGLELFTLSASPKAEGPGTQLTNDGRIKQLPTWSADGKSIAYVGYQDVPPYAAYVISNTGADLGSEPKISSPTSDIFGVSLSPDGTQIASVQINGSGVGKTGVYVGPVEGSMGNLIRADSQVLGPIYWLKDAYGPLARASSRVSHSLAQYARVTVRRARRVRPGSPH